MNQLSLIAMFTSLKELCDAGNLEGVKNVVEKMLYETTHNYKDPVSSKLVIEGDGTIESGAVIHVGTTISNNDKCECDCDEKRIGVKMKTNNRMIRINDEIKREIAEILRGELKDPRVSVMASVVKVDTTADLKYCKVYVSILGDDEEKKSAFEGINSSAGYIRKQLAERINLRNTPELKFFLDESVEYGIKISKMIDEINENNPR